MSDGGDGSIAVQRRTAGRSAKRHPRVTRTGGPLGNEQLTTLTGVLLLLVFAALGLTIVAIGPLLFEHLFIGMLLVGPVALKMASTGYRFVRYYAGNPAYRRKGPPRTWLRLLAPLVVGSTVAVFGTGIALLFVDPADPGLLLLAHKASFVVWLGATGLHVLGHLPKMPAQLHLSAGDRVLLGSRHSTAGRAIVIAGALVAGLVLALALLPDFHTWTAATGVGG